MSLLSVFSAAASLTSKHCISDIIISCRPHWHELEWGISCGLG
jgi:hypothetical protein